MEGVMAGVMGTVGLILFARGAFAELALKELEIGTVRKNAALQEGASLIEGTLQAENTLTAPLSGEPCAWFRLTFRERGERVWRGKGIHEPTALHVADESGSIEIKVPNDNMLPASVDRSVCAKGSPALALYEEHVGAAGMLHSSAVSEQILTSGQVIHAYGTLRDGVLHVTEANHIGTDGLASMQSREASSAFIQLLLGPVVALGALAWAFWPF